VKKMIRGVNNRPVVVIIDADRSDGVPFIGVSGDRAPFLI